MSGRKLNLLKYQSIKDGDMSQASLTSKVTNIQFLDDVGYQLNWSGAPVGNIQIQVSADYAEDYSSPPNVTNPGNWVTLVLTYWNGSVFVTNTSIPTSVGSPIYLDMSFLSAPWIRIVYTKISGSGTLEAFITAKQL